jgi:DNA-binding XRE family transcriptional regulator
MSPDDVKELRRELRCTPRELAHALGLDKATIMAWEDERAFPTKRYIDAMAKLQQAGKGSVVRLRSRRGVNRSPYAALEDPVLWGLFRKLLAHDELRQQVLRLAESFEDPADEGPS